MRSTEYNWWVKVFNSACTAKPQRSIAREPSPRRLTDFMRMIILPLLINLWLTTGQKIWKKILQNRGFLSSYLYGSTANFVGLNSLTLYIPDFLSIFMEMSNVHINNEPFFSSPRCAMNVCTCYLAHHLRPLLVSVQPKSKHLWSAVCSLFLYPKIGSAVCVLAYRELAAVA